MQALLDDIRKQYDESPSQQLLDAIIRLEKELIK